jgi:predicted RNA-binding Zn ribbon-like protein
LVVRSLLEPVGWNEDEEPLCIAFANSVGARRAAQPTEYLKTPDDLAKWLDQRGLAHLAPTEDFRRRAIALRESIYHVFSPLAAGVEPDQAAFEVLNEHLSRALAQVRISRDGWTWHVSDPGERFLMLVALSAAEILTSERVARVRECADEECGWLFIDASKNRSRRWCSMSDCGNLAKARRFQAKKRGKNS